MVTAAATPFDHVSPNCIDDFGGISHVSDRAKPLSLGEARKRLNEKIAQNLASPPTAPVRTLKSSEVSVTPINEGRVFEHKYVDEMDLMSFWAPKRSFGKEIRFKNSRGKDHVIRVIAPPSHRQFLDDMTDLILKLPANVLEATELVELQGFIRAEDISGYAQPGKIVLFREGLKDWVLSHEFGHNVASYVWGSIRPWKEWTKAFKKDGGKFVSDYPETSRFDLHYGEDFAESVRLYLSDAASFRAKFPNRTAVLDTIFHSDGGRSAFAPGGVWDPIRDHYGSTLSQILRWPVNEPIRAAAYGGAAIFATGGGIGFVYFKSKPNSETPTLQPKPPENPN